MTIKERILEFAKACNYSRTAIAGEMGISEAAFRQSKSTSVDNVATLLENFPELNAEWLLRGEGDMLRPEGATALTSEDMAFYEVLIAQKNERIDQLEREIARLKASVLTK